MHTHKTTEQLQADITRQIRRADKRETKDAQVGHRWEVNAQGTVTKYKVAGRARALRNAIGGTLRQVGPKGEVVFG